MWLPAFVIPTRLAPDVWARHALARLGASLLACLGLVLVPSIVASLGHWTDAVCLFHAATGLPCPGCGITTSLLALGRGDLPAAWAANPAGLAVAGLLLAQAVVAAAVLHAGRSVPGIAWLSWLDRCVIGALLAAWGGRLIWVVS